MFERARPPSFTTPLTYEHQANALIADQLNKPSASYQAAKHLALDSGNKLAAYQQRVIQAYIRQRIRQLAAKAPELRQHPRILRQQPRPQPRTPSNRGGNTYSKMGRWRSAAGLLLLQLLAGAHAAEESVVSHDTIHIRLETARAEAEQNTATEPERLKATSMLRHVLAESLGRQCRPLHPDQVHETRRHTRRRGSCSELGRV